MFSQVPVFCNKVFYEPDCIPGHCQVNVHVEQDWRYWQEIGCTALKLKARGGYHKR